MASKTMSQLVQDAILILPQDGAKVVFDDYKASLYAAMPNEGQSVFAHMIKKDLIGKVLESTPEGVAVLKVYKLA